MTFVHQSSNSENAHTPESHAERTVGRVLGIRILSLSPYLVVFSFAKYKKHDQGLQIGPSPLHTQKRGVSDISDRM